MSARRFHKQRNEWRSRDVLAMRAACLSLRFSSLRMPRPPAYTWWTTHVDGRHT